MALYSALLEGARARDFRWSVSGWLDNTEIKQRKLAEDYSVASVCCYSNKTNGNMSDDRAERSDGKIVKMEIDYSATVDQRLPECEKLAKVSWMDGDVRLSHDAVTLLTSST